MKKTLALLLTLTMLITMAFPAGAFSFETVESVENLPEEVQSETDSAALTADVVLGINLVTGTKELANFEDETQATNFSAADMNGGMNIVSNPVSNFDETKAIDAEGTYGKMLHLSRSANPGRHWSGYEYAHSFDGSRKYWITWDEYLDMQGITTAQGWLVDFLGAGKHVDVGFNAAANKWRHYSNAITPNRKSLRAWGKFTNLPVPDYDQTDPTVPLDWYLDNYGIYPMYKITFVMPDGTVKTEDFLFEDGVEWKPEKLATEYAPGMKYLSTYTQDGKIFKPLGWALTKDSATPVDKVALAGEDLTFFPVIEEIEVLTTDAFAIKIDGGVATVTAKEPVTWKYDVGFTGATVVTTDTTAVITAASESGAVKLTATLVSDEKSSADIEILILGSVNWRPGHNILTGTAGPLTFENMDQDTVNAILSGAVVEDNKNQSGINYSQKILKLASEGGYPSFWIKEFKGHPISTERPLYISYDYYGNFDCHWLMINATQATDIFKDMGGAGYAKTSEWKHILVNSALSESKTKHPELNHLGLELGNSNVNIYVDNFTVIPYYKVTYMNFDDTVAKTDYILLDSNNNFLTEFTPDTSIVSGAVAYSLTKGGDQIEKVTLANKDIVLYPLDKVTGPVTFTDGKTGVEESPDFETSYTIPAPDKLGFKLDNFICWIAPNGKFFYAGDVVKPENRGDVEGLTLTAFCQDLTKPAMGFAYEGGLPADGTGKLAYQENIEDEGRNVIHLRQYASTYDKGRKAWLSDARVHFRMQSGFDASEYNIFQYCYKIGSSTEMTNNVTPDNLADAVLKERTGVTTATFFTYYGQNTYFGGKNGLMYIGAQGVHSMIYDNQYHVYEVDQGLAKNNSAPWTGGDDGKLYGFAIDPNTVNFAGDTYIDYVRVYRDGVFTVTYDTNVDSDYEELGCVLHKVAPDTGRGGGTGYLLKGDRPEVQDLTFVGWALKPDATRKDVVTSIDLKGDTTVYAVWEETPAYPNADDTNVSIRSGADKVNGIRFFSSISNTTRDFVDEYGFIVAREDVLGTKELTFGFKALGENKPLYVYGAAYDKKNGIDRQYDNDGENIMFTAVCTNIPAEHYATKLVARTYAKYSINGNAFTVYGSSVTRSIKEIAQSIHDAGGDAYAENKDYIDTILGLNA